MKKFALCLLVGIVLILGTGLAGVGEYLPGEKSDSFDVIAGRLQGKCKSVAGTSCKGNAGQVASEVCKIGVTDSPGFCVGECSGSKHDILDSSEAGSATMEDDYCCSPPYYCAKVLNDEVEVIGGTPVSPTAAGVTCLMTKTRNKCIQN